MSLKKYGDKVDEEDKQTADRYSLDSQCSRQPREHQITLIGISAIYITSNHILSLRDDSANLYELNVVCHEELEDGDVIDSIIDHVTQTPSILSHIQVLTIQAECVVQNLHNLSICQSLTTLELSEIAMEITPFNFPSLKCFYLFDCRFESGSETFFNAFEDCANLEQLFIDDCFFYGEIQNFQIVAPKLIELRISHWRVDEVFDSDCVIELFTPKLQLFRYHDSYMYEFSTEESLSFVEEVYIDMDEFSEDKDLFLRLTELFEIMESAKSVFLSTSIIQVLSMFSKELAEESSPFSRVETIKLIKDSSSSSSSSYAVPSTVMNYLFGKSTEFDIYEWKGEKKVHKKFG
ncbi:unnamed protein product [Sphenostylis stenocarpa]|uniref:Uncharacterized protein n=1 Tax=Sphenostylis stenocarpa TaxID=92480 RepID=A0AA86VCX5_9FABA|nr:unnamed protein product [Sphenostylis stenocarpa]